MRLFRFFCRSAVIACSLFLCRSAVIVRSRTSFKILLRHSVFPQIRLGYVEYLTRSSGKMTCQKPIFRLKRTVGPNRLHMSFLMRKTDYRNVHRSGGRLCKSASCQKHRHIGSCFRRGRNEHATASILPSNIRRISSISSGRFCIC